MNELKRQTVIIVLGMHRSGTSCLTGTLEAAGVYLGDVKTHSPFNKKGNRENPTIFTLQESILQKSGGCWHTPPKDINIDDNIIIELKKSIEEYKTHPVWGFKDPRTLFTLPIWLKILQRHNIHLVASFRHPMAVALSLQKRNKFEINRGLHLWLSYNQRLKTLMQCHPISLFNFDAEPQLYHEHVAQFINKLELPVVESVDKFYDNTLINESYVTGDTGNMDVDSLYHFLSRKWREQYARNI